MSDDSLRRFEELDADARKEYLEVMRLLAAFVLKRRIDDLQNNTPNSDGGNLEDRAN